ncbi:hypothetical protein O6H91_02G133800 [Diphasiastrum complanatum]|uniref:Uncharacterized protein n=2 Tax=Diphasiastrum complanatum TaxID=34168 RepID=A0ACC2EL95_DIPCM|nr:hypothetical protein O6H91_03G015900 [Diphasiastrum complanatum]KAJ7567152.1 hypothetical protein O6H91_02G133800 [Diphasiastrum complanatum]
MGIQKFGHTRTILNSLRRLHQSYHSFSIENVVKQKVQFGECGNSPEYLGNLACGVGAQVPASGLFTVGVSTMYNRGSSYIASDEGSMPPSFTLSREPKIVFVLGGPGSGKGTQCAKVAKAFGFEHLSAGDLLRAEIYSDSDEGRAIQSMIREGKIVSSEVTVNLIHRAMQDSRCDRFLIDGFPRSEENRLVYDKVIGIDPLFVLFFDCSLEEMEARLLSRNQGRIDDNIETIRKRFKVFAEVTLPVIEYYRSLGKVVTVNAARAQQEIFKSILPIFSSIDESMRVNHTVNQKLVI